MLIHYLLDTFFIFSFLLFFTYSISSIFQCILILHLSCFLFFVGFFLSFSICLIYSFFLSLILLLHLQKSKKMLWKSNNLHIFCKKDTFVTLKIKKIEKKKQVNICKFSYKNVMIYKFFKLKVTIYIFSVQKDAQNLFVKKGLTILWDCPINTKNNDKQIVFVFFSFIQHTVNLIKHMRIINSNVQ